MLRRTKIVCTIGPSSNSISELRKLASAGMNIARLNFSHGNHQQHQKIINNLRLIEKESGKCLPIMGDLQGPKIRIGQVAAEGIIVKRGQECVFTTSQTKEKILKNQTFIPVQYQNLIKDSKVGDSLLIDDGLIELKILKKGKKSLICKTKNSGLIKSLKGVNLVGSSISAPALSKKDLLDLNFALKNNLDFIALSFVKTAKDIENLRKLINKTGKKIQIIAKIERPEAIMELEKITKAADGLMVARGDLGIEIPAENVPLVQKKLISLANKEGKPVITATQVLQSMVENPRPTRAEISDAANAVFDHTDAIMLSNETAVGHYPFKAVKVLCKVAKTVEGELAKDNELLELALRSNKPREAALADTTTLNACELAKDLNAKALIVYTVSGYTARHTAKHRPYLPIIVITPNPKSARELQLVWGINQIIIEKKIKSSTDKVKEIIKIIHHQKLAKKGDKVVIVGNANRKEKFITNLEI